MSATKSEDKATLVLYRGWLDPGKHVWSPFVIKLEARLRFAGVSYITECGSARTAPKGKIPYLECSEGTLSDSTLIIKQLVELGRLPDLNANLSPAAKATDLALRALLEDKLYFYHTWERWVLNYYTMRDHILSALSWPIRVLIGSLIYRGSVRTLHGQGTGRYTADELRAFRREIWESVNGLLVSNKARTASDRPLWVFGGDEPTEADATLFGFIVSVLICTTASESQKLVKEFPVILEYAGRIHDTYFLDYMKWTL
ncbi:hypothetical protein B7463_g9259, partial [Scytalidium lignicola]